MTLPDAYTALKAAHVAAAMAFTGGVIGMAVLLPAIGRLPLAAEPVARSALRWSRRVTTPAMLLVWALGLTLGLDGGWFAQPWLQAKLVAVATLSALHGLQSGALRRWAGGAAPGAVAASPRVAYAALACVAAIAVLAVAKPG